MVKRLVILIVGIAVVVGGRWLFYYGGWYGAPTVPTVPYDSITVPAPAVAKFTESGKEGAGIMLVDAGHGNLFDPEELSVFIERVLSRGYVIEYLNTEKEKEREVALKARLALVDAFAVAVPKTPFTLQEIALVSDFVDKGGKLILVGEATRPSQINSLAKQFGMTFQSDYLYNQKENEGNYRNIFVREFKDSDLTKGLQRIVFYGASSISPSDRGLAFADADTFSNLVQSNERFAPMLMGKNNRVLAMSDMNLMGEPYNSAYDNNRLVANIADWITRSERRFPLTDFPHFFRGKVKIEVSDPRYIDLGVKVKTVLEGFQKTAELGKFEETNSDRVFLGLFSDADNVSEELKAGRISVTTGKEISVDIGGMGQVYRSETAMLYLHSGSKGRTLILLADVETGLQRLVDGLTRGDFRQLLARDDIALSYLKKPDDRPTPTVTPRPTPTVTPRPTPTLTPKP